MGMGISLEETMTGRSGDFGNSLHNNGNPVLSISFHIRVRHLKYQGYYSYPPPL